jgi:hypothetical protein
MHYLMILLASNHTMCSYLTPTEKKKKKKKTQQETSKKKEETRRRKERKNTVRVGKCGLLQVQNLALLYPGGGIPPMAKLASEQAPVVCRLAEHLEIPNLVVQMRHKYELS